MRYTRNQLIKLRSGQGVWRVLFYSKDGRVKGDITRYAVVGKKIHHCFRHHETDQLQYISVRMECRRVERQWRSASPAFGRNYESTARFLGDLLGDGAFSKRSQAERFIREVEAGLHPEITDRTRWQADMDKEMAAYFLRRDDVGIYTGEDLDDLEIDSGEHGYPMDQAWNESQGHGD